MKNTLQFLLKSIVDHPESVKVDEADADGRLTLTITAAPEDMGKVIGKSGRIIKSIRDIMKILAAKRNQYIDIVLAEQELRAPASPAGGPASDQTATK